VTTPIDHVKDAGAELVGTQKRGVGAPLGNGPTEAKGHAEERTDAARQHAVQVAERTEIMRDTPQRTAVDGTRLRDEALAGAHGYAAFETDFRGHHETNAARRRGPYENYRVIYRYGYDLGTDTRYCSAAWATVEQDARPRWEERNPGTWEEFKETIRCAWDTARRRRDDC
jgi:hypothetical protein